jgi:opacity protein-like surface antigen
MRSMFRALILTSAALCASAAFAADHAKVNIPFNFETRGVAYPAGTYVATLDKNRNVLTLQNVQEPTESLLWIVSPADETAISAPMVLDFDGLGNTYHLRTVQLGTRITPRLDAPAKRLIAGSFVTAVSGQ